MGNRRWFESNPPQILFFKQRRPRPRSVSVFLLSNGCSYFIGEPRSKFSFFIYLQQSFLIFGIGRHVRVLSPLAWAIVKSSILLLSSYKPNVLFISHRSNNFFSRCAALNLVFSKSNLILALSFSELRLKSDFEKTKFRAAHLLKK